jgi:lysyl oxidase
MRTFAVLTAALAVAGCVSDRSTGVRGETTRPSFTQNAPDLIGLPDLIVDSKATQNNWVTRVEDFPADFCSVIEGDVTPGTHKVIRFTVTTPNIGSADVYIGSPLKHMDPNGDGNFSDQDGLFEFATCHNHFHFKNYATYRLIDPVTGEVWKSAKRGFCMLDTDPFNTQTGDGTWNYRSCGTVTLDGNQGISVGWADTYVFKLGGQYFVLDGGDGQPVVPPGTYIIRVEVNPAYAPTNGVCPRVTDPKTGLCHQFEESDYANNIGEATVIITDHPGRAGYGPLKNSPNNLTASDEIEHKDNK